MKYFVRKIFSRKKAEVREDFIRNVIKHHLKYFEKHKRSNRNEMQ